MSQRVSLINGKNKNQDYDLAKIFQSLGNSGVAEGLEVQSGNITSGYAFVNITRDGKTFPVLFSLDSNLSIDTSGTKKVFIEINQANIDDGSINNPDGTGIGEIRTASSYPSTNFIKLASISSGSITDEREFIKGYFAKTNTPNNFTEKQSFRDVDIQGVIQNSLKGFGASGFGNKLKGFTLPIPLYGEWNRDDYSTFYNVGDIFDYGTDKGLLTTIIRDKDGNDITPSNVRYMYRDNGGMEISNISSIAPVTIEISRTGGGNIGHIRNLIMMYYWRDSYIKNGKWEIYSGGNWEERYSHTELPRENTQSIPIGRWNVEKLRITINEAGSLNSIRIRNLIGIHLLDNSNSYWLSRDGGTIHGNLEVKGNIIGTITPIILSYNNSIKIRADTTRNNDGYDVLVKKLKLPGNIYGKGTVKVSYDYRHSNGTTVGSDNNRYWINLKDLNGVLKGTSLEVDNVGTSDFQTKQGSLTVEKGDYLELYTNGQNSEGLEVRNFRVYYNEVAANLSEEVLLN